MTNLESILYYEKLHDIFERVHPMDMPIKLDKLIKYLSEGSEHFEKSHGDSVDVGDVIGTLEEMKSAFADSLTRSCRSVLLSNQQRNYEVNIYPIRNFLIDNPCIAGDLAELKSKMVVLANDSNLGLFKQSYTFVDSLSVALEN
jgi:hypothetical protein